jgi:hypothetical protein
LDQERHNQIHFTLLESTLPANLRCYEKKKKKLKKKKIFKISYLMQVYAMVVNQPDHKTPGILYKNNLLTGQGTGTLLVTKSLRLMATLSRTRRIFVAAAGLAGEDVTAGTGFFRHGGSLVGAVELGGL